MTPVRLLIDHFDLLAIKSGNRSSSLPLLNVLEVLNN
jgi:hypothetical protein